MIVFITIKNQTAQLSKFFEKKTVLTGFFQILLEKNRNKPAIKTGFYSTGFFTLANPGNGTVYKKKQGQVMMHL